MPRPRVTFSRNGSTSSVPSGPPKPSTSSASRRPAGAGSDDGATPPLLRTAREGASSGRCPGGVIDAPSGSGCRGRENSDANCVALPLDAYGVKAAVDVHDLAGGRGEP